MTSFGVTKFQSLSSLNRAIVITASKTVVPALFLWLCGYVVYTTGRFTFSLALLFVLVVSVLLTCNVFLFFFSRFGIVITSPVEERTGLCVFRAFVCLFCTR